MQKRIISILVLIFVLIFLLLSAACTMQPTDNPSGEKLQIVTTTSVIAELTQAIGGEHVDILNIVSPGSCPGHFDLKPSDLVNIGEADMFLLHDWQGDLLHSQLADAAGNKDLEVVTISVQGNWMTPPTRLQAAEMIQDLLSQHDPKNRQFYQENVSQVEKETLAVNADLQQILKELAPESINVVCDEMQAGFVHWAGFTVVTTFGDPEDAGPQKMQLLLDKSQEKHVHLVIDNLQSGHEAGRRLSEQLNTAHVVLSNFPGTYPGATGWAETLKINVQLIAEALNN